MTLVRPNVTIENTINDACDGFTLADTTGLYDVTTNPLGYGLPGGILVNDVEGLTIVIRNETTGLYFTYVFVISLAVTQTVTLSVQGGSPVDITALFAVTGWPFVQNVNEFDPFVDYGVTLPDFVDGCFQTEYTITGNSNRGGGTEAFAYTTSETFLVDCTTACCISKMLADIDPNCSCSDKKQALATSAYTWLLSARAAANYGQVDKAVADLQKAADMCNCDCGCA